MALKLENIYTNPYFAARERLQNNLQSLYNDEDWISISRGNNPMSLDAYIYALDKMPKDKAALDKFADEYKYDYADSQNRIAAISNEIYADRSTLIKRKRPIIDENGYYLYKDGHKISPDSENIDETKLQYEEYEMTDYDYYKNLIKQNNERLYQKRLLNEVEANKSHRERFLSAVAGFGAELSSGFLGQLNDIGAFFNGVGEFIKAAFTGKDVSEAYVEGVAKGSSEKLTEAQQKILDFVRMETTLRNAETGEYTTIGKYLGGMGDSIGKMMPSMMINFVGQGAGAGLNALSNSARSVAILSQALSTAATVTTKTISVISQGLFYAGMNAGTVREMYNEFAKEGVSIPYTAIMLNAGVKAALQWGIEVALGKLMGGSAIDKLAFGRKQTPKGFGTAAGIVSLFSDAHEEGLEEVFQDFSDWMVDKFTTKITGENFGRFTELTPQSLFDSYIIAYVTSFAGTSIRVGLGRQVSTDKIAYDKDGNAIKDRFGNIKTQKLGKLASYAYKLSLQDWVSDAQKVIKMSQRANVLNDTKKAAKYTSMAVDVYKQFTVLSQIYDEIGPERFKVANDILTELQNEAKDVQGLLGYDTSLKPSKYSKQTLQANFAGTTFEFTNSTDFNLDVNGTTINVGNDVRQMLQSLGDMNIYNARGYTKKGEEALQEAQDRLAKKLQEHGQTKIKNAIVDGDKTALSKESPEVITKIEKIIKDTKGTPNEVKTVVITKDGNNITFDEGNKVLFVPDNYITYADDTNNNLFYHTRAEQKLIEAVSTGTKFKGDVLNKILTKFREVSGKPNASMEEAVMNVMFNVSFFEIMLIDSTSDMYQFLSSLKGMHDAIVTNDIISSVEKKKYAKVINDCKKVIMQYLANQQNASVDIPLLSKDEQKKVLMQRWCKNLYNKVINGEELSSDDIRVIQNRINYMNIPKIEKERLYNNIRSDNAGARMDAMNRVSRAYYNVFESVYDGRTYMPQYCIQNQVFNNWLMNAGLTIRTLSVATEQDVNNITQVFGDIEEGTDEFNNALMAYRTELFEKYTNNSYTFEYNEDTKQIIIKDLRTNKNVGFSNYYATLNTIEVGESNARKTLVTEIGTNREYIREVIDENVDPATREYLSVNDIIVDPTLLNKSAQQKILKKYKTLNANNAFLYLRDYVVSRSKGNSSIVAKQNGQYVMANITGMENIWKSGKNIVKSDIKDGVTLKDLIKQQYAYGSIADTKIKVVDDKDIYAEYVRFDNTGKYNNTIYVTSAALDSSMLTFLMSHEIQHAIQSENQLNLGYDYRWMSRIRDEKLKKKIIADVKKNRPELFRGKGKNDEQIVNDFVYLASGEYQAYGLEGNSRYIDFEPVIIQTTGKSNTIIMPWGTRYTIQGVEGAVAGMSIRKIISDEVVNDKQYQQFVNSFRGNNEGVYKDNVVIENSPLTDKIRNSYQARIDKLLTKADVENLSTNDKLELIKLNLSLNLNSKVSNLESDTMLPYFAIYENFKGITEYEYSEILDIAQLGFIDDANVNFDLMLNISNSAMDSAFRGIGAKQQYYIYYGAISVKEFVENFRAGDFVFSKGDINRLFANTFESIYKTDNNYKTLGSFYRDFETGEFSSTFNQEYYTNNMPEDLSLSGQIAYEQALVNKIYEDDIESYTREDIEKSDVFKKVIEYWYNTIGVESIDSLSSNDSYLYNTKKLYKDTANMLKDEIEKQDFTKIVKENAPKAFTISELYNNLDKGSTDFFEVYLDTDLLIPTEFVKNYYNTLKEADEELSLSSFTKALEGYDFWKLWEINDKAVKLLKSTLLDERIDDSAFTYEVFLMQLMNVNDEQGQEYSDDNKIPYELYTIPMRLSKLLLNKYNDDLRFYVNVDSPVSGTTYKSSTIKNDVHVTIRNNSSYLISRDKAVPSHDLTKIDKTTGELLTVYEAKNDWYLTVLHELFHTIVNKSLKGNYNIPAFNTVRKLISTIKNLYDAGNKYITSIVKNNVFARWNYGSDYVKVEDDFKVQPEKYFEEIAAEYFSTNYASLKNAPYYDKLTDEYLQSIVLDLHQQLNIIPLSDNVHFYDYDTDVWDVPDVFRQSARPIRTDDERIRKYERQGYTDVHIVKNDTGKHDWIDKIVYTNEEGKQISTDYTRPNRYIKVERQKSTNLKYFRQTQMAKNMRQFIINSTHKDGRVRVADELWDKIGGEHKGTLRYKDVMDWLYNMDFDTEDPLDLSTFKLINRCFFGNEFIQEPQQLQWFVDNTAELYALSVIVNTYARENERYEELMHKPVLTEKDVKEVMKVIMEDKNLKAVFDSLIKDFNQDIFGKALTALGEGTTKFTKKYSQVYEKYDKDSGAIDTKALRKLFMENYNGTLSSARVPGAIARVVAKNNYKSSSSIQQVSLESGQDSHNDETNLSVLENIAQTDNGIFAGYISENSKYLGYALQLLEWLDAIEWKKLYEKYGDAMYIETGLKGQALQEFVDERTKNIKGIGSSIYLPAKHDKSFENIYRRILYYFNAHQEEMENFIATVNAKMFGKDVSVTDDYVSDVRTPRTVVTSIKHSVNTLKDAVPKKYYKMVLEDEDAAGLFDENLNLKPENYLMENSKGRNVYQDIDTLKLLQSRVVELSQKYRAIFSHGKRSEQAVNKFVKTQLKEQQKKIEDEARGEISQLKKEVRGLEAENEYLKRTIRMSDNELTYESKVPMPNIFKNFLFTELDEARKSRIQFDKIDANNTFDREYAARNFKAFLEKYSSKIMSMSQQEVDELVEFLCNSQMDMVTDDANVFNSLRMAFIGLLIDGTSLGNWTISAEQKAQLEDNLGRGINASASALANFKTLIANMHPEKIIAQSIKRSFGIDYADLDEDVEGVIHAAKFQHTHPEWLVEARKKLYDNALKAAMEKKKNPFDVLLRIQKTMMLSGPGTWARNLISNVEVSSLNAASDLIMSLVKDDKKVAKVETSTGIKQYKITKTKVDKRYVDWIANTIMSTPDEKTAKALTKEELKLLKENSFYSQFTGGFASKYEENIPSNNYWERVRENNDILGNLIAKSAVKEASVEAAKLGNVLLARAQRKGVKEDSFQYAVIKVIDKLDRAANALVYKGISDEAFVRRKFVYYLGKILTEDNIDVIEGQVSNQAMNAIADAYIMACNDYMHSTNIVNNIDRIIRSKLGAGAYFIYKQVFPFLAPSLNWFAEGLKFTPLGLIRAIVRYARLENTINKMEDKRQKGELIPSSRFAHFIAKRDLGKGIIGTIGTIIGIALVASGKAGIDDSDDKLKIFVGDTSVDISQLFGTQGILVGMAFTSAIRNAVERKNSDMDEKAKRQRVLNDIISVINTTFDQMFIDTTISDLFNTFRYSNTFAEYASTIPFNSLQMFIPNFVKTFTMFNKYKVKYDSGLLGKVEKLAVNALPQIAYAMPKYIDPYTGETQVAYKAWFPVQVWNKLMPLDIQPYNISDAEKIAIELGLNKGQLTGRYTINDDKLNLTSKDVEKLNKLYGKLNNDELSKFLSGREKYRVQQADGTYKELRYGQMTDKQKAAVINRIMSNNSSYSKVSVLTSMGYKYYASSEDYARLKKLGITHNVYKANEKHPEGFEKIS